MRILFCRLSLFLVLCFMQVTVVSASDAGRFHNGLSLQGFTGVLNTPNAHVTDEGWFYGLYTNQEESKWREKTSFQDNYQFSVGFFNFIELGGRFFEAPGAGRDLSGNVKVTTAHFTERKPLLPVFAAGIQDVGGGAALLQTSYVVASEDLGPLRVSVGYGKGPDRMKGPFGGAELKVLDYLYLLGDYDTTEKNVGVRLVTPQFWKVPVSFTATAKTSLSYQPGNFDIALGLSFPLDFRMKKEQRGFKPAERTLPVPGEREAALTVAPSVTSGKVQGPDALRAALVAEGLVNVRVGTKDRTLVVEYENVIFNHNELDALGLVVGLSCQAAPDGFDTLSVVSKRRDIATVSVTAPLAELRAFLSGDGRDEQLRRHLSVDYDTSRLDSAVFAAGDRNWGGFNTSLMLAPSLSTWIGTEVGAFDYYLSLKPELSTMLWKGAAVTARWNVPLDWSHNLEPGGHYRSGWQPTQLDRLMLFQAVKPVPSVIVQLGGGMVVHDRYGMLNEGVWSPGDGTHRFRIAQGWTQQEGGGKNSDLLLGSYRYYYSPLDLSIEAAAGKFWAEDKGGSLEVKRFWEDTSVSLYLKGSTGTDKKEWQAVGIQFSFPLTPRRDMKPVAKLQLRGADEWSYAQESTLPNNNDNNRRGSLNYLAPYPLAVNPQPTQALYRSFYNRDRLSDSYIREHLERLKEAWLKYGRSI